MFCIIIRKPKNLSFFGIQFQAYYTKGDKVIAVASMQADPLVSKVSELIRLNKMLSASEIREGKVGPHPAVISLARAKSALGMCRILWRLIFHLLLCIWKLLMKFRRRRRGLAIDLRPKKDDIALRFVCHSNSNSYLWPMYNTVPCGTSSVFIRFSNRSLEFNSSSSTPCTLAPNG